MNLNINGRKADGDCHIVFSVLFSPLGLMYGVQVPYAWLLVLLGKGVTLVTPQPFIQMVLTWHSFSFSSVDKSELYLKSLF